MTESESDADNGVDEPSHGSDTSGDEEEDEEQDEKEDEDEEDAGVSKNRNQRSDAPGLIPKPPPDWKLQPRGVFTILKDHASAASIAARNVFCLGGGPHITAAEIARAKQPYDPEVDEFEFREITCHVHASGRWVSQCKLFLPYKKVYTVSEVKSLFQKDLDVFLKNIPFIHLKPVVLHYFKEKWEKLGQEAAVNLWLSSWGHLRITRVEANEMDVSPFRGGVPCDNNALESSNNVDKLLLGRKKSAVSDFVDSLGMNIVGPASASDVRWNNPLKTRSGGYKGTFNKAPNNAETFKHVWAQWERYKKNPTAPSTISSMHPIRFAVKDMKRGMYYFLSDHGINKIQSEIVEECKQGGDEDDDSLENYDPNDMAAVRKWMDHHTNWGAVIETLLKDPENAHFLTEIDFNQLHDWCRRFHVFIPIRFNRRDWEQPSNRALLHWCEMLKLTGIQVIPAQEIVERKKPKEGMFACTCEMYMHYMVCKHTMLLYLDSGIITYLPKGGTPMQKKKSRKRKAHGGESLTFDS
jgi:hypothetical protein